MNEHDEWSPPTKTWPSREEVRNLVKIICDFIDASPDWAPPSKEIKVPSPDESWEGWKK